MGEWILCSDRLPPEKKYVIVKHCSPWRDQYDQENVCTSVAKLIYGISMEERSRLENGNMMDKHRSKTIEFCDEYWNNKLPYAWDTFSSLKFNGQDIIKWKEI